MKFSKGSFAIGLLVGGFIGAAVIAFLASSVIEQNNKDIAAFKNLAKSQGDALDKCRDITGSLVKNMKALSKQLAEPSPPAAPSQGQPLPVVPSR